MAVHRCHFGCPLATPNLFFEQDYGRERGGQLTTEKLHKQGILPRS